MKWLPVLYFWSSTSWSGCQCCTHEVVASVVSLIFHLMKWLPVLYLWSSTSWSDCQCCACCLEGWPYSHGKVLSMLMPSFVVVLLICLLKLLSFQFIRTIQCFVFSVFIVPCKLHCVTKKTYMWLHLWRWFELELSDCNNFWHTYYWEYRPLIDVFIFPPHLFHAPTLTWEHVET